MKQLIGLGAALCIAATPAAAQRDFSDVEIEATEVAGGVFMLTGAGGNIGLSTGKDGAFVIDDQFAPLSDKILAAIKAAGEESVEFVVNTHWHGDHTGGNEAIGATGAHIVAHENVRKRLKEGLVTERRNTPPAPEGALPVITFNDGVSFHWNDQHIRAVHMAHAHTDGDSIVFFSPANVVHMGDIFFNGGFPFIDLASGGDLDGYIAAHEKVLSMIDDEARIIPGHGPLASKADLQKATDMLKEVRTRIAALVADGVDEEAAVAARPLEDFEGEWGQGFINGEFMTRTAHQSLSR